MRSITRLRAYVLSVVAAAALASSGCGATLVCRDKLLELRESPDHRYNAALLVRSCPGEPVVTHVNLHNGYGGPPAESDGRATRGEVFTVEGEHKVVLTWRGAGDLQVECFGCAGRKVARKDASWEDVRITYAERQ